MTVLTDVLTTMVVVLLATSFVVFLVRLTLTVGRGRKKPVEFGVGFSVFIALWMGSELLGSSSLAPLLTSRRSSTSP